MNRLPLLAIMLLGFFSSSALHAAELWIEKDKHHTAVIITRADLEQTAPVLAAMGGKGKYLRFGWGDRVYYGASDRHPGDLLRALFVPSDSVLEVTALAGPAQDTSLRRLSVTDARLRQVVHRIINTLDTGGARLDRREPGGRYYYRAAPRYHLLANCNHWTARLLADAGIELRYLPSTFSGSLWRQLDSALASQSLALP